MSVANPTVCGLLFESMKTLAMSRIVSCDPATLDFEAQWAVWEALRDVPVYRKDETFATVAGQTEYALTLPPTEHAVSVLAAWFGTRRLVGGEAAPIERPTGTPDSVALTSANTVKIWPAPVAGELLSLRVEYSVTVLPLASVTATYAIMTTESQPVPIPPADPPAMPDPYGAAPYVMPQCLTPYLDMVVELILARMFAMPDKPWTNPSAAAWHRRVYHSRMQNATWEDQRSNVAGSKRVRAPRFA